MAGIGRGAVRRLGKRSGKRTPIIRSAYWNRSRYWNHTGRLRGLCRVAAGGAVDDLARIIGARLGNAFRQPVVVENHAGVGGNLGADLVAKSAPDGTTILQTTNGQAISPALYRKLPFDAVADFAPVTQLVASTLVLVSTPGLPVASTAELIERVRS